MDEYTWTQQTPFGPITISAGEEGVRSIRFDARNGKKSRVRRGASTDAVPARFRKIAACLDRYFDGDAQALDGIAIDLGELGSEFYVSVLTTLRELAGPGDTISYGELAAAVGHPGAARAVGSVMANNPIPIIIPCHRVLASDGTLGGYGGGLDMKRELLRLEGADVPTKRKGRQVRRREPRP